MNTAVRLGVTAVAMLGLMATMPTASAAGQSAPTVNQPIETIDIKGIKVDKEASEESKQIIESNAAVAVAAANVCGTGYTISTNAVRYGTYGTTYTWTNGTTSGSSYYDKPICAVFFNDTGASKSMGVRLRSNYTADAPAEDFGTYSSYAGPVYQKRGYCGTAYSYMKSGSTVVVDNIFTVGSCN
ncbi:hypothetical protein ACFXKG_17135 [Streptomyces sp. NPDC059255]|uniref:hypothetical protein n=1 Tax=Streptomyces sp. NPDC059255 TaxID=3346793 RepID=UPI0036BF03E6